MEVDLRETIDNFRAAYPEFSDHFGLETVDHSPLTPLNLWGCYCRSAAKEPPPYYTADRQFLPVARAARQMDVIVPIEQIFWEFGSADDPHRPILRRIMANPYEIKGLIFPSLDRLARNHALLEHLEFQFWKARIKLYYCDIESDRGSIYNPMMYEAVAEMLEARRRRIPRRSTR